MDRIDRITDMERRFDSLCTCREQLQAALDSYNAAAEDIAALINYYDSGSWMLDYEADERGELPADLKRGVLSEDGLYNLICDIDDLRAEFKQLAPVGDKEQDE